jgi:hypothetical protein
VLHSLAMLRQVPVDYRPRQVYICDVRPLLLLLLPVHRHMDLLVSRACARRGCCLIVVDLLAITSGVADQKRGLASLGSSAVEAWLGSLLAPGTQVPDGALAHITLDKACLQGVWRRKQDRWTVQPAPPPALPGLLALLYVDSPVARLPVTSENSSATSSASRYHRMSLLLKVQHPASSLSFVGSDASAAAPASNTNDRGTTATQCVARGSWGTCLPVVVAGVEAEGQPAASSSTTRDMRHMYPERVHDGYMLQQVSAGTLIALTVRPVLHNSLQIRQCSAACAGLLQVTNNRLAMLSTTDFLLA